MAAADSAPALPAAQVALYNSIKEESRRSEERFVFIYTSAQVGSGRGGSACWKAWRQSPTPLLSRPLHTASRWPLLLQDADAICALRILEVRHRPGICGGAACGSRPAGPQCNAKLGEP